MSERFEEAVIAHCAPTLAGHKCGSLFSWRKTGGQDLAQEQRQPSASAKGRARAAAQVLPGGRAGICLPPGHAA